MTTANLQLYQPTYNNVGWHNRINENFAVIDAAITQFFTAAQFQGAWLNNTAYVVGDQVVDATDSNIYTCDIGHTSAVSPTTFSADRVANPTYWSNTTVIAAVGRGSWVTATVYNKGDFVSDGSIYAVCVTAHTSGATFAGDAVKWDYLIDVSAAGLADGSVNGAKFASPLTIPGATTITTGGLTVTAGGLAVTAGATTLQGTTIQTGGLAVTAGGIGVTAGGLTVTAGGLNVAAGGATIIGNSTITGTLTGLTGLTVSGIVTANGLTLPSGGITVTGNSTITGTLGGLTGLTVASGGASITGNSTIAGTLGGLTGLTVASGFINASSSGVKFSDNTTQTTAALTVSDIQTFNAVGANTWTKPAGAQMVMVEIWSPGGSGARESGGITNAGGGSGGGYVSVLLAASSLSATETATNGAAGTAVSVNGDGVAGGSSTFTIGGVSSITVTGGGAGKNTGSSNPGGTLSVLGATMRLLYSESGRLGTTNGGSAGDSIMSGGGGAGGGNSASNALSPDGGDGGAVDTVGGTPGGGGGASTTTSGAGGPGRIRVTSF